MSDNEAIEWLRAYRDGDVEALGLLVEHFRRPLFAFIIRTLGSPRDAEEIFQDTWLKAVKNIDRFDHHEQEKKILSWLFTISKNVVIDRSRKRKPNISLDQVNDENVDMQERIAAPGINPAQVSAGRELGERIQDAVHSLPEDQRHIYLLRTEADLSFKEIAETENISINTALARMQYALQKLRTILAEDYESFVQVI